MFTNWKASEIAYSNYLHQQRVIRQLYRSFYAGVGNKFDLSTNDSTNLLEGGSKMGSDCKKIDWSKPVRSVPGDTDYSNKHSPVSGGRRLIQWDAQSWGPSACIVDERGHVLWHSHSSRYVGEHFVENAPEEKREWFVFVKYIDGAWDYLRMGHQPYTNSYADEVIEKYVTKSRLRNYSDYIKVKADPVMIENFTLPND